MSGDDDTDCLVAMCWRDRLLWARERGIYRSQLARILGCTRENVRQRASRYEIVLPDAPAWAPRGRRHPGGQRLPIHMKRMTPEQIEDYRFLTARKRLRKAEALSAMGLA